MDDKIDKITEVLTQVQIDIAEIRKDVNYHILRTDQNDDKIQMIADTVKPIQEHVAFINGLGKLGTGLLALLTAVITIWQFILGGK